MTTKKVTVTDCRAEVKKATKKGDSHLWPPPAEPAVGSAAREGGKEKREEVTKKVTKKVTVTDCRAEAKDGGKKGDSHL